MKSSQKFQVLFFDSFAQARAAEASIATACSQPDITQINVVIREEGNMDDAELLGLHSKVKVYAGAAWTTIHERRQADGWYVGETASQA
jgi:hypothetical protein